LKVFGLPKLLYLIAKVECLLLLNRALHDTQQVAEEAIAMNLDLRILAVPIGANPNVLRSNFAILLQPHLRHQTLGDLQVAIELIVQEILINEFGNVGHYLNTKDLIGNLE